MSGANISDGFDFIDCHTYTYKTMNISKISIFIQVKFLPAIIFLTTVDFLSDPATRGCPELLGLRAFPGGGSGGVRDQSSGLGHITHHRWPLFPSVSGEVVMATSLAITGLGAWSAAPSAGRGSPPTAGTRCLTFPEQGFDLEGFSKHIVPNGRFRLTRPAVPGPRDS